MTTVNEVHDFWDRHPLWGGESPNTPGTREFFEQHDRVVIEDGFAGEIDERIFPGGETRGRVLDLGCGPGFWTVQLGKGDFKWVESISTT